MPNRRIAWSILLCTTLFGIAVPQAAASRPNPIKEIVDTLAKIDGREYRLQTMLYRPDDAARHPLIVMSHGRNGKHPSRRPGALYLNAELCYSLALEGFVVAYVVRRGYGESEGEDVELRDTAVTSGLEAAKDYAAAVEYWRDRKFVLPEKVVLMGQSQGGWAVLACATVPMKGVLGVVNISGGTNYASMGLGLVTASVRNHWVAGCAELGAKALVPSLWIYSENDKSISGPTSRRMFGAYTAAGGKAEMLMLPSFGDDGHAIVSEPSLFIDELIAYLRKIGARAGK